jgi:SAM-dependent methyltransferase
MPRAMRRSTRRLLYLPVDAAERLLGIRDALTPPRGISAVGLGDFREVGRGFVESFRDLGGLRPSDRVLDVGCGVGRMAIPLTEYLNEAGTYDGFDVVRSDIRWCRRAISSRHPRFRFTHADCANAEYNPGGRIDAWRFRFPWPDASFDFAFATSVFTHLLPEAAENYFREAARTLARDGRFYFTAFVLNARSRAELDAGRTSYVFPHPIGNARTSDAANPESAIAYEEAALMALLERAGLRPLAPLIEGTWAGGAGPSYQDAILAGHR